MANPPRILTEQVVQDIVNKAIAKHEMRFSLYGLPLIVGVILELWLK